MPNGRRSTVPGSPNAPSSPATCARSWKPQTPCSGTRRRPRVRPRRGPASRLEHRSRQATRRLPRRRQPRGQGPSPGGDLPCPAAPQVRPVAHHLHLARPGGRGVPRPQSPLRSHAGPLSPGGGPHPRPLRYRLPLWRDPLARRAALRATRGGGGGNSLLPSRPLAVLSSGGLPSVDLLLDLVSDPAHLDSLSLGEQRERLVSWGEERDHMLSADRSEEALEVAQIGQGGP